MIRVAILGATGSIGRSALEVVSRHPDRFEVAALTSHRRVGALAELVARFRPALAVVADEHALLPPADGSTRWARGREAVLEAAAAPGVDVVVNALVGAAGLEPTLLALETGHRVALANKESLVAGGPLVLRAAGRGRAEIIPIDSEHSAILQCLEGYDRAAVRRITLTASGGPFRGRNSDDLWNVRPAEALNHPTWDMGSKVTVDSGTLANKALEVIEAHYLYGFGYQRIGAVVHPQSIVHSFVEFVDGSVLAQMGFPNMELPILYALNYPERAEDAALQTFDPVKASPLTFEEIDHSAFPLFQLGVQAGVRGGCAPAVFNAGNEIAVQAFLEEKIRFPEMAAVVSHALEGVGTHEVHEVQDVLAADLAARNLAAQAVERLGKARQGKTA
ncbi:MAG: 1-deoxy-D-xylulose-5-phosphate reductoisomerase [Longimicrobiales bacterium]|nr:1-deoxy-D-xylulose-5-phosphate reductoisomerase [Longimicrobiales bacterium]